MRLLCNRYFKKDVGEGDILELYKSRDASKKLFSGDKSYLGNKSLRVQSDVAAVAAAGTRKSITLDEKIEKHRKQLGKRRPDRMLPSKNGRIFLRKNAQRNQELLKAVKNSSRSFDEIMGFLKGDLDD